MTATATNPAHVRLLRLARRALDHVERALRPDAGDHAADDEDTETTRDILLPATTGEPPARRAERQAHDYLARRRRKLARQLDDPVQSR